MASKGSLAARREQAEEEITSCVEQLVEYLDLRDDLIRAIRHPKGRADQIVERQTNQFCAVRDALKAVVSVLLPAPDADAPELELDDDMDTFAEAEAETDVSTLSTDGEPMEQARMQRHYGKRLKRLNPNDKRIHANVKAQ